MQDVEIRRMVEADLDVVWNLEKELFAIPWPKSSLLFEVSDNRVSYPLTALVGGAIVGYAVGWFVGDELHVGNVAVARSMQGQGLGKRLLEHLLGEARVRKVRYATLEVRVSNTRAIALYRRYGFKGIAFRKRYYSDNGEDALVMLAETAEAGAEDSGHQNRG